MGQEGLTGDPGRKGASRDVLVIVLDQDAVVSRQDRQVGHSARPILVVHTADVGLGRTLNGQGQTTCREWEAKLTLGLLQVQIFFSGRKSEGALGQVRHTLPSVFSIDSKHSRFVDGAVDEAWTVGADVATVHVVHIELQWTSCEDRRRER